MAGTVGAIPNTITKAKKSTSKFVKKITEVNNDIIFGKKEIDPLERAGAILEGGKKRADMVKKVSFFCF